MSDMLTDFSQQLSKQWGWIAFRGVLALLFGILALSWPGVTVLMIAIFWGAFIFADGILILYSGWQLHKQGFKWGSYLFYGVLNLFAGAVALLWPEISITALVFVMAFWAIFSGVSAIAAAIRLRKEIEGEWAAILLGIISVAFGLALFIWPLAGVLTLLYLASFYAFLIGCLNLIVAFRLRKLKNS